MGGLLLIGLGKTVGLRLPRAMCPRRNRRLQLDLHPPLMEL
jgi:hypothetical protein